MNVSKDSRSLPIQRIVVIKWGKSKDVETQRVWHRYTGLKDDITGDMIWGNLHFLGFGSLRSWPVRLLV